MPGPSGESPGEASLRGLCNPGSMRLWPVRLFWGWEVNMMKKQIDRSTSNRFQWNRNCTDCKVVTTKQFGSSHSWSCTSERNNKWQVYKHRNLRLAYIAQQHMFHLAEFMNSTPYVYIQRRYQNGYDEALMGPCRGMFFFGWSTRDGFFLLSLSIWGGATRRSTGNLCMYCTFL